MAERKFRFVSPGIFINEVDNSQLPNDLPDVGPIIVGRAERGPAMRPVRVGSPSEFVEYFGNPLPGGRGDDVWRDGNYVGPTYGAYAATRDHTGNKWRSVWSLPLPLGFRRVW